MAVLASIGMTSILSEPEAKGNKESSQVIEVRGLTKRFVKGSNFAAVNNVSFDVGKEVVALFGPSGCGKTTTLRCIAGLEKPDEGEIVIDGKIVTSARKGIFEPPEKRNIGLVFQSYALWPHMKVYDNVAFGLKVRHVPKSEVKQKVLHALEIVGLGGYEDRYPSQLSGGQQQRVALARSLVYEPKVLLLDEPLSNLDAKIRETTRVELKKLLTRIGIASVYVTHDQEEAFLLSDKIVVMSNGVVMQQDTPHNIYNRPANTFVASFVGRSNMIDAIVVSKTSEKNGVVRVFGKYDIECAVPETLNAGSKCSIIVRANEVGLSRVPDSNGKYVPCEVLSREYKGAVTDHLVRVDDVSLIVTTHKFCDLNAVHEEDEPSSGKAFLQIRGDAVTVVPSGTGSSSESHSKQTA